MWARLLEPITADYMFPELWLDGIEVWRRRQETTYPNPKPNLNPNHNHNPNPNHNNNVGMALGTNQYWLVMVWAVIEWHRGVA